MAEDADAIGLNVLYSRAELGGVRPADQADAFKR